MVIAGGRVRTWQSFRARASVLHSTNLLARAPRKAVAQQQPGFGLSPYVTASSHLPFLSWFSCSSHPGYRGLARPGAAATIV